MTPFLYPVAKVWQMPPNPALVTSDVIRCPERGFKTNKKYKGGKKKRVGSRLGRHAAGERANGVHGMEEKRSGYGGPCRTEGAEAPCFFLVVRHIL